jgi:hypothetical protein
MSRKYVTVILSSSGLTSTSTDFSIYADNNNYAYPIVKNITNTELTATTTPFNLLVDSTASRIMVLDTNNNKKTYADIGTNNLCITCGLDFNYYPTSTVGRLYAGILTGSCQSEINEYRINWYGPNSSTNVAYTSGSGTSFSYRYTHPLTGATGLFALAGTYFPVIDKVKIGGIAFSQSGDTLYSNDPVPALLTCFESVTVEVDAFKCDNGDSSDLPQYEHRVLFTAVGNGVLPSPLSSTFLLSADTNYFAWKFKGEGVPDKLKLTYYGSAYNYTPILLDFWEVGSDLTSNNFGFTTFPKSADTSGYISKLTCLTGFTINENDTIIMEVTPNTSNPSTNWDFYFACVDSIDCTFNLPNKPMKISGSTITGITYPCYSIVTFKVSGATSTEKDDFELKNYANYSYTSTNSQGFSTIQSSNLFFSQISCGGSIYNYQLPYVTCLPNAAYNITYGKSDGLFKMTTNNPSYITYYYNQYNTNIKPLISTYSADSTNIDFYRYFYLTYPAATGSTVCGDGTIRKDLILHQSSVVSTGMTGSDYYLQYTMPTISIGLSASTCDLYCNSNYQSVVSQVNSYSTGTTFNYTGITNTASRYDYLNSGMLVTYSSTTTQNTYNTELRRDLSYYINYTVPASGVSNTLITSLSATTCQFVEDNFVNYNTYYRFYDGHFKVELTNPSNWADFQLFVNTTIETTKSINPENWKLLYTFSGGTVNYSYPQYII